MIACRIFNECRPNLSSVAYDIELHRMEKRRRKCKSHLLLRVILVITLCVTVAYCLRTIHYQTPLLCAQQEVSYSTAEISGTFSVTDEDSGLKYAQLLQDILRSYQHYHTARRRELADGTTSKTLTWYCISGCNGIGDRVIGMHSAFLLAVVTNRTFFIHQSDAVQKTMFLEPSAIDWRPVHKCVELPHNQTLEHFGHTNFFQKNVFGMKKNFSLELNRLDNVDDIYISGIKTISATIKSILHSEVLFARLSPLHRRLLQTVIRSGPGAHEYLFVSLLHKFLFRLPLQVRELTDLKLTQLKLLPRRFVTVHIRTGFKNSLLGEVLATREFFKGDRFARSKDTWRSMIDCAMNISDTRFGKNSTVLVVSDDKEPKNWAASEYKSRVTMLDIDPVHVDNKPILGVFGTKSSDAYLDTWVELSVMSRSSAIVGIYSGYARVASHVGSLGAHSVFIYSISRETCNHLN